MCDFAYYIDLSLIWSIAILLFSLSTSDNEFKIFALILLMMNTLLTTKEIISEDKKRAIFNANSQLKCEVAKDIFYPSKEDNWSMESHYFIKNNEVIKIGDCELNDEKVK